MAKFNLKEHIAKNKATFFGSLTEGQFSWMTQDTGQQIGSQEGNTIPVYMFDNTGKYWFEKEYEGYGVFGGKDYYELLDQMNGGTGDRSEGVRKAFDPTSKGKLLFPALVVGASNFDYKTHDFTQEAEHDPNQSWLSPEEEEDYDMDREEDYDYSDYDYSDGEELEEGKAAYEYEKGKKAGEEKSNYQKLIDAGYSENDAEDFADEFEQGGVKVPQKVKDILTNESVKSKMKKSELKAKIKEMIVAEMDGPAEVAKEYDFLAELESMLNEAEGLTPLQDYVYQYEIEISGEDRAQEFLDDIKRLNTPQDVYDYYAYERDWSGSMDNDLENIFRQVKRKFKNLNEADEEADAEATDEVAPEEVDTTVDVTTDEVDPNVKDVQDALTQAQAAAQKLGDPKLTDQIGNTITFFTRSHVVEKPTGAVSENLNESMFPMLKKILK
jgi:hypothetical protein